MNLAQKIGASVGVVAFNMLCLGAIGYLTNDIGNILVLSCLDGTIAGITVVLDKYVNQNIISNKSIQ